MYEKYFSPYLSSRLIKFIFPVLFSFLLFTWHLPAMARILGEHLARADRLMASGNIAEARMILVGVISSDPGTEEALLASLALVDLTNRAGNPAETIETSPDKGSAPSAAITGTIIANKTTPPGTAIANKTTPPDTRVLSAPEARAEKYEKLAEKMSSSSRPSMLLRAGEAHLAAGNNARAIELLKEAEQGADGKTLGAVYLGMAVVCEKTGDQAGRLEALRKCIDLGGKAAETAEKMLRLSEKGK